MSQSFLLSFLPPSYVAPVCVWKALSVAGLHTENRGKQAFSVDYFWFSVIGHEEGSVTVN